jgi:PAS domain S-box-containing protein
MSQPDPTVPPATANEWWKLLFEAHPSPMWVYDPHTLEFLAVNSAALAHYGYSREEFLQMKATEIRPEEEIPRLMKRLSEPLATVNRVSDWRHRKKDGTIIDVEITSHAVDFQGRPARIVLASDITERKRLQESLANSERHFRALVERGAGTITVVDANGTVTYDTSTLETLTGFEPEEMLGKSIFDFIHPDDRATAQTAFRQLLEQPERSLKVEIRALAKHGPHRILHVTATNLLNDPAVRGIVLNSTDITNLRKSEEQLQLAQHASGAGVWDWNMVTDELDWSPEFFRLIGLDPRTAKASFEAWRKILHPDDRMATEQQIEAAIRNRTPLIIEYRIVMPTGEVRWLTARGNTTYDANGKPQRMSGICLDITERQRFEEALKESEERYRMMLEAAPMLAWRCGEDAGCIDCNQRWYKYTGQTPEEVRGNGWMAAVHPDDRANTLRRVEQVATTGEYYETEYRLRRASDGQYRWHLARAMPFRNEAGKVIHWFGYGTDIHDQKLAEAVLRESEERYRLMAEAVPALAWRADADGGTTHCNQRWLSYTGQTQEEARGNGWMRALHPDDLNRVMQKVHDDVHGGEIYQAEYRLRRAADGAYRWHLARGIPLRDANGRVLAWFGCAVDIEEQKRAEELLRQSEENYRLFADSIPVPAWRTDAKGLAMYCNVQWCEYTGQTEAQFIRTGWMQSVHPADRRQTRRIIEKTLGEAKFYQAEYRLRRHDGEYRWHLARGLPSRDRDGKLIGWFGTSSDIHEQKTMQETLQEIVEERTAALHESEDRNRSLLEMAPMGISVVADGKFRYANPECARVVGVRDPSELIGRKVLDFTHREDRRWSQEHLQKVFHSRAAWPSQEQKLVRQDGTVRMVLVSSVPIVFEGKPAALTVFRDVTELRRLERELVEISSREQVRIGQDLHDSVCQQLAGVALACQGLQNSLTRQAPNLVKTAADIHAYVERALTETRALAQGLAPTELQNNDLAASLRNLASTTTQLFGVKCTVESDPVLPQMSPQQTLHFYRIAQEAISNAVRHGKAKRIRVSMRYRIKRLEMTVDDNGRGISKAATAGQTTGMGLPTMRYRAGMIGASLTVKRSRRSHGTIVACWLPVATPTRRSQRSKARKGLT